MNFNKAYRNLPFILIPLTLIFISLPFTLIGANNENESLNRVFKLIYNQKFDSAMSELFISRNNLNPLKYKMLELDLYWWKALSSNSENDLNHFENILAKHFSGALNQNDSDKLGELICLSYSFRLSAIKNHYFSMMLNMIKMNKIVKQVEIDKMPGEEREIFMIYTAVFNIGKSKLFFNNPRLYNESIKVLERNITSINLVYQTISNYFLSKIYIEIEKVPAKAKVYCERLCKMYPGNEIFAHNLDLCKSR
jgi:hypothetical protein